MSEAIEVIPGGHVTSPEGFSAGATSAGIKTRQGALDLAMLLSDRDAAVAGMFTQNKVRAASVIVSEKRVAIGHLRGVVSNAGCANAITGAPGIADAEELARLAATKACVPADSFAMSSTGVTGVRLPMDKVRAGIEAITLSDDGGVSFARAIMTTDTRPKEIAVRVPDASGSYTIAGCCKGSGMIHPDMATMLCYLTTDAAVAPDLLRSTLREVIDDTINLVSVDGDTSCSDTTLIFANGAAGLPQIEAATDRASLFQQALRQVCTHLARALARDGEGANHLIEVVVTGAASRDDARKLARLLTTSPLLKTAVAGEDANWGRVLVAAGRAGVYLEEAKTRLVMQGELLFDRGAIIPFDEATLHAKLGDEEVRIELDLGLGEGAATAWGCDLTVDYVKINADYRT